MSLTKLSAIMKGVKNSKRWGAVSKPAREIEHGIPRKNKAVIINTMFDRLDK
ncbi:MAG: hypothetical protein BWY95_00433 [Bacteroidetes bacterium ADurb.BinA104]|nr:MAG: hypothetical protein BWY95_00433 [Bacteroidetes bacterium ADurb.BinA104]